MNWNKIRKEFETTDISMAELARKHGVKPGTLRSRKNREKWGESVATQKKNVATVKRPKMVIENDDLTEQQKLFCLLYLQYFNATKAYREAYPEVTYNTARTEGAKLLAKPCIKTELTRLNGELQQDMYMSVKDLIKEYAKQAFADITDFVEFGQTEYIDEGGMQRKRSYVLLKDSEEVDGTLVQEVKHGRDGVTVKLHDKQRAMEALMKYLTVDDLKIAQIEKAKADARLAEYKVQNNDDINSSVEVVIVNEWAGDDDEENITED